MTAETVRAKSPHLTREHVHAIPTHLAIVTSPLLSHDGAAPELPPTSTTQSRPSVGHAMAALSDLVGDEAFMTVSVAVALDALAAARGTAKSNNLWCQRSIQPTQL